MTLSNLYLLHWSFSVAAPENNGFPGQLPDVRVKPNWKEKICDLKLLKNTT